MIDADTGASALSLLPLDGTITMGAEDDTVAVRTITPTHSTERDASNCGDGETIGEDIGASALTLLPRDITMFAAPEMKPWPCAQ